MGFLEIAPLVSTKNWQNAAGYVNKILLKVILSMRMSGISKKKLLEGLTHLGHYCGCCQYGRIRTLNYMASSSCIG